ncbi:cytoplasmic dynein 2 intermediate chain 1 isoform X2 [Hemibagrus wyckioides]|uniref:cytoplasmic dynein 2 intermediate chain 1 isoform X2 n=1 Tax=Hemibagrus wyckioides TaxID=337641 RepID=UPI00266D58FC|nr:cytoplasmic dynein 2 intermediate chain 1 isoform X2 [Hemibagrus wyckioides]
MYSGKKITKEDTWRPDDLIKHIRSQEEESSRRRERSHRDPERERRKQREESGRRGGGETRDEREKESRKQREREPGDTQDRGDRERQRDRYKDRDREKEKERDRLRERDREKEKERDRDGLRERAKERDREKEKEREKRNREKERNKESDREKDREREKRDRGKDREREKRDWVKDREREKRDREKDREREKKDREKYGDREKKDREKDRDRLREKERDRAREAVRDRGEERDREKDRERERRRAERENERRKEMVHLDVGDKSLEREKERKERHREREHRRGGEEQGREWREQERREKHGHRQNTGQTDTEERREQKRREKEQHVQFNHDRELEIERRHRHQNGDGAREREERDKRREKRHDDSSQRHREHESVQRKTLQEVHTHTHTHTVLDSDWSEEKMCYVCSHVSVSMQVEHDVTEDNREEAVDYGNEDYEDDFEDYEEDFEEFDEDKEEEGEEEEEVHEDERREVKRELSPCSRREVEAIQRAMEKENELLSTAHSTQESEISITVSADSESRLRNSRTYSRVIDFTAARQREINQQASDKQRKRSSELLRLIDLDFSVTECLLDLPPVREYDLYIRSYGMANTKQAYVQCNEDYMERDAQTDETDVTDKWTQHPPESSTACGGPQVSQNASDETVTKTTADSKQLAAFLRSATQVMAVLLEENIAESNSVKKLQSQTYTHSFSDGCVQLNTKLNLLQGRQVTLLHFSQTQTHTLLSVHALHSGSIDATLDSKTLICVWNIWEPSTPQRILIYEAEVRSCCFSPGKSMLVFAGTDVGSVLVWDLREHSGSHTHTRVCEEEWTLRHPTFSTDAVLSGAGHFSPVVSIEPVLVNVGAGLRDPLLPDQEESLGLSFQLGSLDENGLLNLWVVVELPRADDSGSQTDLGLRPGGKVKLLHSSSLQTIPRVDKGVLGVTSHLSFVLKFLPSDYNHYFIGSNLGLVRHGTRHGLRAVPKLYRPKGGEKPAEVTALEFCPAGEPFFLVGCSDGSVRLHALACDEAVCEWTVGPGHGSVQCVQFSPTRCSVFCALDSTSVLHIWDLTQRDESPIITQDLHTDLVSAMAVFGDASKQNPYSGIAMAKHSGRLEVHFLLPSLTLPQASDKEKLHLLTRDTL